MKVEFSRLVCLVLVSTSLTSCQLFKKQPIKVGVLHSLSGTMSISEVSVKNATLLAIDEINAKGGLLGRQIEPVIADGKSDWPTFAAEAEKLITESKVSAVFGCWTSASRKTVKPVFEKHNHLLFYPVQYEGLEQSPNIIYTGAAPNQQIIPALKWVMENIGKSVYLVGSDYVFPRSANAIIKLGITALRGKLVGEDYVLLGSTDVKNIVDRIIKAKPSIILNTINGDSNVAFFKELRSRGITSDKIPIMSFSIAEPELQKMGTQMSIGDYAAWNYFQSIDSAENKTFVDSYKAKYGKDEVISDPMEAAYFGVNLWAKSVQAADTDQISAVKTALKSASFNAPEGRVYIDQENNHTWKTVRIGRVLPDGQFKIVWTSEKPIGPVPFPVYHTKQEWEEFLVTMYHNWQNSWANPSKTQ